MNEHFYGTQNSLRKETAISELALKQKFLSWMRNHLVASQFEWGGGGGCLTFKVPYSSPLPMTMCEVATDRHFYCLGGKKERYGTSFRNY